MSVLHGQYNLWPVFPQILFVSLGISVALSVKTLDEDFTIRCKFKFNNSREGYNIALERIREEMIKAGYKGVML